MISDTQHLMQNVGELTTIINTPFWKSVDFWIHTVLSSLGLIFAILAFIEARRAKHAATEAGKIVKIQTITIELTEISQRLDRLEPDIHFNEARDMLSEASRRLRRAISPFQKDPELAETIEKLKSSLDSAKITLNGVRPSDTSQGNQPPNAVYYAIEGDFAIISGFVAELLGLFEKKTINLGGSNA
jgi:hypothetical protein